MIDQRGWEVNYHVIKGSAILVMDIYAKRSPVELGFDNYVRNNDSNDAEEVPVYEKIFQVSIL